MDIVNALGRMGGVATRAALVRATSRRTFDSAVARGDIVRDGYGRYALPIATDAMRAANALSGVSSHGTAALHWGWEVKRVPAFPDVTVSRNRSISPELRAGVTLHWGTLAEEDVDGMVTARPRSIVDCMRTLPFDEALTIADSALRRRSFTPEQLIALASLVRGPGAPQARRVAREASALAANPFESVLRAISLDVPGLDLRPQVVIRDEHGRGRPDLVDEARRLVVEAESYTWHSSRRAVRRDCRRYTRLVLLGWRVLRFSWEDVMHHSGYVRTCLREAAGIVTEQAGSAPGSGHAA